MNLLLSVTRPWPSPITRLDSGIHGQSVFYLVLAMSSLLSSSVPPFTFRCLNSAKTSKLTLEASSSASVTVLSQIDSTADLFSKALGMVPSLQCRSSVTKHFRSVPTRSDSNHLLGYLVLQLPTGQSSVTIFKDLIMIEAELEAVLVQSSRREEDEEEFIAAAESTRHQEGTRSIANKGRREMEESKGGEPLGFRGVENGGRGDHRNQGKTEVRWEQSHGRSPPEQPR